MDPLSITAGCVALTATATKLADTITRFVRDVRAARGDLDAISRELGSLQLILLTLEDEFQDDGSGESVEIPDTLRKQIHDMVGNCQAVLKDIDNLLEEQKSSRIGEASKWSLTGRADVRKLQVSLEAHRSALEIALELVNVHTTKAIKKDTAEVVETTRNIKSDTEQILMEIERLREQLPKNGHNNFMLERYLDQLTSYAETVVDGNDSLYDAVEGRQSSEHDLDVRSSEHVDAIASNPYSTSERDEVEFPENPQLPPPILKNIKHLKMFLKDHAAQGYPTLADLDHLGREGTYESSDNGELNRAQPPTVDRSNVSSSLPIRVAAASAAHQNTSTQDTSPARPRAYVARKPVEHGSPQASERQPSSQENNRIKELILHQESTNHVEEYPLLSYSDIRKTHFKTQSRSAINMGFNFQCAQNRTVIKLAIVLTSFPQQAYKADGSRGAQRYAQLHPVPFYAEDPYQLIKVMHQELGLIGQEMLLVVHDHQTRIQHEESLKYLGFKRSLQRDGLSTFLESHLHLYRSEKKVRVVSHEIHFLRICEHSLDPIEALSTETALVSRLSPRLTVHAHSLSAVISHRSEIGRAYQAVEDRGFFVRGVPAGGMSARGVFWLKPRMLGGHKLVEARRGGTNSDPMF